MFLINPYILQASGNPLWNDLLAYYTADNTPNDALGTYNGTLTNGATYGTGIINNAFSLDGVNDYVEAIAPSHNYSLTTSYNVWVKPTSVDSQKFFIYLPAGVSGPGVGVLNGTVTFTSGSVNGRAFSTIALPLNTWTMITVVFKGNSFGSNNVLFYKNGVYSNSNSLSVYDSNSYTLLQIGKGPSYYSGGIDEVGIWSRELTAAEITELYNSGAGLQY